MNIIIHRTQVSVNISIHRTVDIIIHRTQVSVNTIILRTQVSVDIIIHRAQVSVDIIILRTQVSVKISIHRTQVSVDIIIHRYAISFPSDNKRLVGWLAGWLVGWLFGWLVGWLVGWVWMACWGSLSWFAACLFACLASQQHASVFHGRISSDHFACRHTEMKDADQTDCCLIHSQFSDTQPTSPSAGPVTPDTLQDSERSMTRPAKGPIQKAGFDLGVCRASGQCLTAVPPTHSVLSTCILCVFDCVYVLP